MRNVASVVFAAGAVSALSTPSFAQAIFSGKKRTSMTSKLTLRIRRTAACLAVLSGMVLSAEPLPGPGEPLQTFGDWKSYPGHTELQVRVRCNYFNEFAKLYVWDVQFRNISKQSMHLWWDIDKHFYGPGHDAGGALYVQPGDVVNAPINFTKAGPSERLEVRITKLEYLNSKNDRLTQDQQAANAKEQERLNRQVAKVQAASDAKAKKDNEAKAQEQLRIAKAEVKAKAKAEHPGGGFWSTLGTIGVGVATGVASMPPPPQYPTPVPTAAPTASTQPVKQQANATCYGRRKGNGEEIRYPPPCQSCPGIRTAYWDPIDGKCYNGD